ncbi:MAG TPA: TIGR03667 family PPOX class F420-dependent oxidoreductase [Ktedonobacterales bacterium]
MPPFELPAADTPFGARVAAHLRDDIVVWLITTGADGTPQPNPVWFLWDGTNFLIYSLPDAARLAHIKAVPRVALNFAGNGAGGDIVIFTGSAHIASEEPPAHQNAAYIAKYRERMARSFGDPATFAARYSTPVRVEPTKLRGH